MRSPVLRSGSPRRLVLLLLSIVLPPALALVWLGVRLVEQDRALLAQYEAERRDAAADALTRSLLLSLHTAERWMNDGTVPAGAVRMVAVPEGVRLEPSRHALWTPGQVPLSEAATAPFLEAETLEFQGRGDRGLSKYAALSRASDPRVRAGAILRLARVHRSQNNLDDAMGAYRQLAEIRGVSMDGTPADLIARRMICELLERSGRANDLRSESAALRDAMLGGTWVLDRAAWELSAADVSRWTGGMPAQPARQALSAAADWLFERAREPDWPRSGRRVITVEKAAVTVAWARSENALKAALLGPGVVEGWLRLAAESESLPLSGIALLTDSGIAVVGTKPVATARVATRSHAETGLPWTVIVSDTGAPVAAAELRSRRRLLWSGLAALSVVLAGGGYLLWRVVRREVAIARLHADFVAAVSHEFRTPLTSLRHITELLQENDDMPAARRASFYSVLGHSTERLHRLVESVLDVASMEDGRRPWDLRTVDIAEVIGTTVADFQKEHVDRSVSFAVDTPMTLARADGTALSRAVWNLLDNAAKYSPDGGPIDVAVRAAADSIAIEIRDLGLGISSAERNDIFGKFVRGARARQLGIKGTGLGLAIVSHIVDAHGGTIAIDSEEGRGSTFTIVLPLTAPGGPGNHTSAVDNASCRKSSSLKTNRRSR